MNKDSRPLYSPKIFIAILGITLVLLPVPAELFGPPGFSPTYWIFLPIIALLGFGTFGIGSRSIWSNIAVTFLFWLCWLSVRLIKKSWSSQILGIKKDAMPILIIACCHALLQVGFKLICKWFFRRTAAPRGFPVIVGK